MADIFNEVDEELRADQARLFWKKHGNLVIGGAFAVVLVAAGWWGWQLYSTRQQEQAAVDFYEAVQAAKDNNSRLDLVASQNGGYAALARLQLAANAVEKDPAKAADMLSAVAQDSKLDPAMRGMAAMQAAQLKLTANKPQDAIQVLQPFVTAGNAYRLSALELTGLAQFASGDKAKAKDTFTQLQQLAASPTGGDPAVAARAGQLLDRLQ